LERKELKLNIIVCTFALILLLPSFCIVGAQEIPAYPPIEVYRLISFHEYGFVMINDTVVFVEPQLPTNFMIGFPALIRSNFGSVFTYDADGELLKANVVTLDEWRDVFWVNVTLPSEKIISNFTMVTIFSDLISNVNGSNYTLTIPPYPVLTTTAVSFNSSIMLPANALVANETYINDVFFEWNNFTNTLANFTIAPPPYIAKMGSLNFSGAVTLVVCQEAYYKIEVDSFGAIHAYDTYYVQNLGEASINSLNFKLPLGAYDIHINDAIGEYPAGKYSIDYRNSDSILTLTLSYPIRGTPWKESIGFTIKYSIPLEQYLQHSGLWENQLTLPIFSRLNCSIPKLTLTISLPEGANFVAYPDGKLSISFLSQSFTCNLSKITSFNSAEIKINYSYPIFWAAFRPTLWVGAIIAILYIALSIQKSHPTIPKVKVPVDLLHTFVEVCEERVSLKRDLKQITEDMSNGKIGRHDFNRRRRMILQGLATLDRDYASLKEKVKKIGTSYAEVLRQLEVADIDIDSTSSNLSRIETEFKANKISKDTYERLRYDYGKKIDKTITTINEILLSLREEIS
jgi:hypothetical protein